MSCSDIQLAREPTVRLEFRFRELEHLEFFGFRLGKARDPRFVDVAMTRRARARAAALRFDPFDAVLERAFHHGVADGDFDFASTVVVLDVRHARHDGSDIR
jgi:hypothetical protein